MRALDLLGVGERRAESDRDVVRHVIAAEREDRRVPDRALAHDRHVSCAAADVDQDDPELLLVGEEHGLGGRNRLQHDVLHVEPGAVHRADHVVDRRDGAGHDVHLGLQAHAGHADRLAHAVLVVHHERLRQDVDDLAVGRQVDGARRVDDALDVDGRHLAIAAGDGDDAPAVHAADVSAGDARVDAGDLDAGLRLGVPDRLLDRVDRRFDVDDDAASEPPRRRRPEADHVEAVRRPGRDDRADLRGPDVQSDDELRIDRAALDHEPPCRSTTWSRKRRSTLLTRLSRPATSASTPSRRASRSAQSSLPSRTSMPSIV